MGTNILISKHVMCGCVMDSSEFAYGNVHGTQTPNKVLTYVMMLLGELF